MPLIKIKRKGCKSFEQHIVPGWSLPQRTYCEQHQRVNRQNFQNLVVFDDHVEIVTSKEAIRIDENGLEITRSTVMEAPSEE